ncbi:MAG TPA: hypothetical protein VGE86_01300, partial [Thermoanaerobaculia bacterium]
MTTGSTRRDAALRALLIVALALLLGGVLALLTWQERTRPVAVVERDEPEPEPPPDLEKFAETFRQGVAAVEAGFGPRAVDLLSSFSFGARPVEQYRLYFLANAHQLVGAVDEARRALAAIWQREPTIAVATDVAFHLGDLYEGAGAHRAAAATFRALATRATEPAVAAAARERHLAARFRMGDVGAVLLTATDITIENPAAPQADQAAAILRSLRGLPDGAPLPLTPEQKLKRVEALLEADRPRAAVDEIANVQPATLPRSQVPHFLLAKGEALQRTGKHKESETLVEPLFSSYYNYAIPALRISVANQRNLADSIQVMETKTTKQRVRAGTRLVKRKGKRVRVPNYKTVTKTVKLKNLAKEAEKKRYEAKYLERLRDLLTLPIDNELERDVLSRIVKVQLEKKDDDALRKYLPRLIELDPADDSALQRFWDVGWTSYTGGNFDRASHSFEF